jgi:hypothetical protein
MPPFEATAQHVCRTTGTLGKKALGLELPAPGLADYEAGLQSSLELTEEDARFAPLPSPHQE